VVGGGDLEKRAQFDSEDGDFGCNAFQVDDVPEPAYLRGVQGAGIEAVFAGILIARRAATLSFCFLTGRGEVLLVHSNKIARVFPCGQGGFVAQFFFSYRRSGVRIPRRQLASKEATQVINR